MVVFLLLLLFLFLFLFCWNDIYPILESAIMQSQQCHTIVALPMLGCWLACCYGVLHSYTLVILWWTLRYELEFLCVGGVAISGRLLDQFMNSCPVLSFYIPTVWHISIRIDLFWFPVNLVFIPVFGLLGFVFISVTRCMPMHCYGQNIYPISPNSWLA
jgi:hypothetical protein